MGQGLTYSLTELTYLQSVPSKYCSQITFDSLTKPQTLVLINGSGVGEGES